MSAYCAWHTANNHIIYPFVLSLRLCVHILLFFEWFGFYTFCELECLFNFFFVSFTGCKMHLTNLKIVQCCRCFRDHHDFILSELRLSIVVRERIKSNIVPKLKFSLDLKFTVIGIGNLDEEINLKDYRALNYLPNRM